MLKFFKRIRKKLLEEGRLKRYSLYAIGEILLVVIGILIALQINNWNEGKKAKDFERKMLTELKASLQANINHLQWGINSSNGILSSCNVISRHIDENLAYHDSLDTHFSNAVSWFNAAFKLQAYESLKSYGEQIITNESIREKLDILEFPWLDIMNERDEKYHFNIVAPLLMELFDSGELSGKIKPYDYEELIKSKEYKHVLNTLIANRTLNIHYFKEWIKGREELVEMINQELSIIQ